MVAFGQLRWASMEAIAGRLSEVGMEPSEISTIVRDGDIESSVAPDGLVEIRLGDQTFQISRNAAHALSDELFSIALIAEQAAKLRSSQP